MKTQFLILACCLLASLATAKNQHFPVDSGSVVIDDILFEASHYQIDASSNTATIVLSVLSKKDVPREFKLNVYGTQVVDNKRNAYYFSTIELGRVLLRFEDKQNYLHYLLQPDTPVNLTITAQGISPDIEFIQLVKLVFEDNQEEGRFVEAYVSGIPTGEP